MKNRHKLHHRYTSDQRVIARICAALMGLAVILGVVGGSAP